MCLLIYYIIIVPVAPETFWPGGSAKFASQVSLPKVKENDRDDIPKSAKLPKASVQDEVLEHCLTCTCVLVGVGPAQCFVAKRGAERGVC